MNRVLLILCAGAWSLTCTSAALARDGLEYVRIPAGTFLMGCTPGDQQCDPLEKPRHRVRISRDFWLARTETTIAAYSRFAQASGYRTAAERDGKGRFWRFEAGEWDWMSGLTFRAPYAKEEPMPADWPAVQLTWHDADAFCRWAGGRLPTEAEWEYAARGGVDGARYPWGDAPTPEVAGRRYANGPSEETAATWPSWEVFRGYRDGYARAAPVASFAANDFGLYDMAGNVYEWVADWIDAQQGYSGADTRSGAATDLVDPSGPSHGKLKVLRGGGWGYPARHLRSSQRGYSDPTFLTATFGFRCARDSPPE